MSQLGFTFYPKDWWTSDSFYLLNPFERYIYLELLFMMYVNDGFVANDRINVERRLLTTIKESVWLKITDLLVKDGDQLTHKSVNARLRKTLANRENGKLGGRPKNPKNPNQKPNQNPPLEKNRIEDELNKNNVSSEKIAGAKAPTNQLEERKLKFGKSLEEFKDKYPREMLQAFYKYWTESNRSKKKMKFELQETFETNLRLATWASRDKNFAPKDQPVKSPKIVKI